MKGSVKGGFERGSDTLELFKNDTRLVGVRGKADKDSLRVHSN